MEEYLSAVFKTKFKWIIAHDVLSRAASSLIHVFLPLYLLEELGMPLWIALSPLVLAVVSYGTLCFWGYKIQKVLGTRNFFIVHIMLNLFHGVFIFILPFHLWALWAYLALSPLLGLFSVWQPYQIYVAKYTDSKLRGRQLGFLSIVALLAGAAGTFFGGYLLTYSGFMVLAAVRYALLAARIVPIYFMDNFYEPDIRLSFRDTLRLIFSKQFRRTFLAQALHGVLGTGNLLWPVFIFVALRSYFSVGSVLSFAMLFQVALSVLVGEVTDRLGRRKVLSSGVVVHMFAWIGRFLIYFLPRSVLLFLGLEAFTSFSAQAVFIPFQSSLYDKVDHDLAYRTLLDMMEHIGAVISILAVTAFAALFPNHEHYVSVYFLFCAVAVLFLPLIVNSEGNKVAQG